jgi:ComF family protein
MPRPLPAPLCAACPDWPRSLSGARSAAPHTGVARELVHTLKYGRELAAARPLGYLATDAARGLPLSPAAIVAPVPLHWRRKRMRGFNQSEEIARIVARELRLKRRGRLLRRVRAGDGTARRSLKGRQREARGAFRAAAEARGASILLVDDVMTTGATLGACARALSRRGAREVWAVTVTRAP